MLWKSKWILVEITEGLVEFPEKKIQFRFFSGLINGFMTRNERLIDIFSM